MNLLFDGKFIVVACLDVNNGRVKYPNINNSKISCMIPLVSSYRSCKMCDGYGNISIEWIKFMIYGLKGDR